MSSSMVNTPIISYVPTGHHDMPMPLGKYYPSNYEAARSRQNSSQNTSRSSGTSLAPPSSSRRPSSSSTRSANGGAPRGRTESDAKRLLQQYQRDMIAHSSLQGSRSVATSTGSTGAFKLAAAHGADVKILQAGSKQAASPRLQPLASPGPVTPMELGAPSDGGYMTLGRPVPSPHVIRDNEAVTRP